MASTKIRSVSHIQEHHIPAAVKLFLQLFHRNGLIHNIITCPFFNTIICKKPSHAHETARRLQLSVVVFAAVLIVVPAAVLAVVLAAVLVVVLAAVLAAVLIVILAVVLIIVLAVVLVVVLTSLGVVHVIVIIFCHDHYLLTRYSFFATGLVWLIFLILFFLFS